MWTRPPGRSRAAKTWRPLPTSPACCPWLAERGATFVIAGGMGQRAIALFNQQGIQVLVGAPALAPEALVEEYLAGRLQGGQNVCDH